MRILYVCGDGVFAGLEKITLQIINRARAHGHDVLCLGSYWGSGQFTERIVADGITLERTWFGFLSLTPRWQPVRMTLAQLRKVPTVWRDFRRVVREWKPDVVHHAKFHHVLLLACSPARPRVPSVYHVHNIFSPTIANRTAFRAIARYVNRFAAVSTAVADSLVKLGVARERITVVLNGVPLPQLSPDARRRSRQAHGVTDRDVVVGIVGQIAPWKGHEDFVRALAVAAATNDAIRGLIVGQGSAEFRTELARLAAELGVKRLEFVGFVDDMEQVYNRLDMLIVPSRFEDPCPMVVAEGLSYGLPVIAARSGGIPEMLGDALADNLVPVGDARALGYKIAALAGNRNLREELGARGRIHAQERLSLERCASHMLRMYGDLLRREPPGPVGSPIGTE